MRDLKEAVHSIATVNRKEVKISKIQPEVIYNSLVERIRAKEY